MIVQRPYQNDQSSQTENSVCMFVGTEVEHSPMHGKTTLFVVGLQPFDTIVNTASQQGVDHIYLGANHSFDPTDHNTQEWDNFIWTLLKTGQFWVTLDFDVRHAEWVAEGGYCESNRFVPMVSVKLPYIGQFNYNTTIKIDDKGFEKSNPGVWCHRLVTLLQPSQFTDWTRYREDQVL